VLTLEHEDNEHGSDPFFLAIAMTLLLFIQQGLLIMEAGVIWPRSLSEALNPDHDLPREGDSPHF
jgi:hypothetical protein